MNRRLTPEATAKIRTLYATVDGITKTALAQRFGVSKTAIAKVLRREAR